MLPTPRPAIGGRHRSRWARARGPLTAAFVAAAAAASLLSAVEPTQAVAEPAAASAPSVAALPTGWSTVVNKGSGKCVDARAAGPPTAPPCSSTPATAAPPSSGVSRRPAAATTGSTTATTPPRSGTSPTSRPPTTPPSSCGPTAAATTSSGSRWRRPVAPTTSSTGTAASAWTCPAASTADGVQLVQYTCNGTAAQSLPGRRRVSTAAGQPRPRPQRDRLRPVDAGRPRSRAELNTVFRQQETNQFGAQRYALLFKPGTYSDDVNVGFYTQVAGPGPVAGRGQHQRRRARGGRLVPAANATQNFWRGAENLSVNPTGGTDRWAVSQAAGYRRMHVRGNLELDDGGWSSGGFIADTKVDGQVRSGTPAAVADPQLAARQLDRLQLEHGLRRQPGRAGQHLPQPALHHGRPDPDGAREALPVRRQRGRLPGVRALAAHQLHGHQLGERERAPAPRSASTSSTSSSPAPPPPRSTRPSPTARTCCSPPASTTSTRPCG